MLADNTPIAVAPTTDMGRARAFYEGVLGFAGGEEEPDGGVRYRSGSSFVMVYPSEFAGTNKATAMSFDLAAEDFDDEATRLRAAGVTFDTFDMDYPGATWQDGVLSMGEARAAWFRDPDGNIIAMATGLDPRA